MQLIRCRPHGADFLRASLATDEMARLTMMMNSTNDGTSDWLQTGGSETGNVVIGRPAKREVQSENTSCVEFQLVL